MHPTPLYVYLVFALAVVATFMLSYWGTSRRRAFTTIVLVWLMLQSILAMAGFYSNFGAMPPRFPAMVIPPLVFILVCLATKKGRAYLDGMDIKTLTLLHTVRIPVELVLYWLYVQKDVPQIMTFEGRNFDILSGITAPVVYYLGFVQPRMGRQWLILWNVACLLLLVNIVGHAVLAAPTPLQQIAFDQPNVAVAHFPFVLLPSFIVPMVLLAHVASLRQLLMRQTQ